MAASLLDFEQAMLNDILDGDALCVTAAGLAWQKLVAVLIRLNSNPESRVVLVIGASPWQRELVVKELQRHDSGLEPPVDITNEVPALDRINYYRTKPCCFVTTRILVVDFLSARIQTEQVAGIIVLNAHRVSDVSGEGFAVRLFRLGNDKGFVRAFSDQAPAFTSGFARVEKVMKALRVRKLSLWPRFQQQVQEELSRQHISVEEWEQELSPAQGAIQEALAEVLEALIRELQRGARLDTSELRVEEGLFRSFDSAVKRQLDPVWHMTSWKTRQITRDLRSVRLLADALLRYDSVTFLGYLEDMRAGEGGRTVWLYLDAAHAIFEQARRRVYVYRAPKLQPAANQPPQQPQQGAAKGKRKQAADSSAAAAAAAAGGTADPDAALRAQLTAVLEEPPKWALLTDVLLEIQQHRAQMAAGQAPPDLQEQQQQQQQQQGEVVDLTDDPCSIGRPAGPPPAEEEPAGPGPSSTAAAAAAAAAAQAAGGAGRAPLDAAGLAALQAAAAAPVLVVARDAHLCRQLEAVVRRGGPAVMQQLYQAYLASKLDRSKARQAREARPSGRGGYQRGRGRGGWQGGRGGGGAAALQRGPQLRPGEMDALLAEAQRVGGGEEEAGGGRGRKKGGRGGKRPRKGQESPTRGEELQQEEDQLAAEELLLQAGDAADAGPCPLLDNVFFHSLDTHDDFVLWRLQPCCVVLYDPDMGFVRRLEVFKAERPGAPLRVYQLQYAASLETQRYLAEVKREREVFASLIDAKQRLVLPQQWEQPAQALALAATGPAGALPPEQWLDVYQANVATRAGGRGQAKKALPRRLVVDVREFMSSLPAVLHQQGFELVPVTLEVGDYVLSPEMVVERKALPDLHQSLASGRLYTQAESMTRHYKTAILLIEFDADRAFALQSPSEMGPDIDHRNVISRLALLLLHHPRLRLLWSRSLHATADMFLAFKANQDEPDAAAAALVGVPVGPDGQPVPGSEATVNQAAVDLLRKLPGVTEANYRGLMAAAGSLAGLADMPVAALEAAMGSARNAKALREFLDAPCPRLG